jgi:hypothetical protein
VVGDARRGVEVLRPRRRHVHAGLVEDPRDVCEVVRLAVDGDLEQRPLAQRIAEAAGPAVARNQTLEEIARIPHVTRLLDEIVERPDEAGGDVIPHEHRP